jgi:hypothetical protein
MWMMYCYFRKILKHQDLLMIQFLHDDEYDQHVLRRKKKTIELFVKYLSNLPSRLFTRSFRSKRSFSFTIISSCRRLNSRNLSCRAFCSCVISSNSRRCWRLASRRVEARFGSYDVQRRSLSRSLRE